MKKQILIIALTLVNAASLIAQTSFSCYYREFCEWNESTEEFGNCEGYEESSLFVMNKDETMFTHTIETMKSTYYINESDYDADKGLWTYSVTSDVGNKYIYVFDPKNKEIRAGFLKDGKTMMIRFYIKAIF